MTGPYAPVAGLLLAAAALVGIVLLSPGLRGRGRRVLLAGAAAAVLAILPAAWGALVRHARFPPGDARRTEVEIAVAPGASARSIGEILAAREVIASPTIFTAAARLSGVAGSLRAGRYRFARGISVAEAIETLRRGGLPDDVEVTIPEGWTLRMIAARLEEAGFGRAEDFLERAKGMEGFLFPDTYRFRPDAGLDDIMKAMRGRFDEVCDSSLLADAARRGLDRHRLATLASIVEREARAVDERPVIAGVYHNRLKIGMPLQADPTVVYALGRDWQAQVTYADLEVESPYNTYRRPGLPPGPIGAPGADALAAAARPADHPYLFFVARADGSGRHDFSKTAAEHARRRAAAKARSRR